MIDYLIGTIKQIKEKTITLLVNGLGFQIHMPQTSHLQKDKELELYTYMHWNQEKGPGIYGFQEEIERTVFLMIIECPKIGPNIAMNILSQMNASQFVQAISNNDENALNKISGIGSKKAEQIIVQLKHKVSKLLISGELITDSQQDFTQWQNINDVLISLNYSRPEISKALRYLTEKYSGQNIPLDKLIRSALSFLSGNI